MTGLLVGAALAPLLVALVIVCVRQPMRVALPIYAALIPFGGAVSVGPSRYGSASSLMGLVLAVGLVGQALSGRRAAPRVPPAVPVWLVFLGLAGVTALWTLDRAETLSGLAVLGSLVIVFVLAACSEVDRDIIRRVENGLLAGGVAVVGYAFFQLIVLGGFVGDTPGAGIEEQGGRFGNGLLGPNIEAVTLCLPLAVGLHRALTDTRPRSRLMGLAAAGLMVLGILMTGSRTGTLAAVVLLLAMLFTAPRGVRLGLVSALVVAAAVSVAVWVYHPLGVAERTFSSATSSSGRTDIWEVGLSACDEYCLLGSGWGTFPDVYAETQASVPGARVLSGEEGSYQPHNVWLLALIETGFLGAVLLTVGLLVSLFEAVRLPPRYRGAAVGSVVAMTFGLVFLSSMEFKVFWMVVLLVSLYGNVAYAESRQRQEAPELVT